MIPLPILYRYLFILRIIRIDNAHVPAGTRVITPNKLSELREAVLVLFVELDGRQLLSDTSEISAAMRRYGIGHNQLFDKYAVRAK